MVFGEYIKQPFAPGTLKNIGNLDRNSNEFDYISRRLMDIYSQFFGI